MRRIVTAREQVQMLAPWLREARNPFQRLGPEYDPATPTGPRGTDLSNPDNPDPAGRLEGMHYDYNDMVDTLVGHYDGATAKQKRVGRMWYKTAHDVFHQFAKDNGISPLMAVTMASAFSPSTDWGDNIKFAQHFMLNYRPYLPDGSVNPDHNEHNWQMAHVDPVALQRFQVTHGRRPTETDEDLHSLADMHSDAFKRGPNLNKVNDLSDPDARANWIGNIQHHGLDKVLDDSKAQAFANRGTEGWRPSQSMRDTMYGGRGTMGGNIAKAKLLYHTYAGNAKDATGLFNILGGPKISNFTNNILDHTWISKKGYYRHPDGNWENHADLGGTIDNHHIDAVAMKHGDWQDVGFGGGAVKRNGIPNAKGELPKLNMSDHHTYNVLNRGLYDATARINAGISDSSKHITPKQLQAIVWIKHKDENKFYRGVGVKSQREFESLPRREQARRKAEFNQNQQNKAEQESFSLTHAMRIAMLDGEDYANMPPLWRKMFLTREAQDFEDLVEAFIEHHNPGYLDSPPEPGEEGDEPPERR